MVFINEGQPGRTEPLWFNFDGIEIPTFAATVETATELANGVLQRRHRDGRPVQGRVAARARTRRPT